MKKIIYLIMGILLLSSVYAQNMFRVTHYEKEGVTVIINVVLIEDNKYYFDYGDNPVYIIGSWFQFLDAEGNILGESPREYPPYTLVGYKEELLSMKKIRLINSTSIIAQIDVNLCNHNGLCEPCLNEECISFENELSCSDCESSSEDGFCNIADDGICDPDCKGYEYDIPPIYEECYEYIIYNAGCEFYELSSCEEGYYCNGREIILEGSGEFCCVDGECKLLNKLELEGPVEIDEIPEKQDYIPIVLAVFIILSISIISFIRIKGSKTK